MKKKIELIERKSKYEIEKNNNYIKNIMNNTLKELENERNRSTVLMVNYEKEKPKKESLKLKIKT